MSKNVLNNYPSDMKIVGVTFKTYETDIPRWCSDCGKFYNDSTLYKKVTNSVGSEVFVELCPNCHSEYKGKRPNCYTCGSEYHETKNPLLDMSDGLVCFKCYIKGKNYTFIQKIFHAVNVFLLNDEDAVELVESLEGNN